jgi:hypothetical protein
MSRSEAYVYTHTLGYDVRLDFSPNGRAKVYRNAQRMCGFEIRQRGAGSGKFTVLMLSEPILLGDSVLAILTLDAQTFRFEAIHHTDGCISTFLSK